MKRKLIGITATIVIFIILLSPGCKKAFVWDPTGIWLFDVYYTDWDQSTVETLTFTGSDSSGTVTGMTAGGGPFSETGVWTKNGDFSITLNFNFWYSGDNLVLTLTGTSSESTPNQISNGTGTFHWSGYQPFDLPWTATKTTNLQ